MESKKYNDFIIGLYSGIVSSIICNPFDVIRTNYQLKNKVNYNFTYLYRGLPISLICIPSYWSIYFGTYSKLKEYKTSAFNGYVACCISSTFTTPLWVLRQKYQVNSEFNIINFYKQNNISVFFNGLKTTYIINLSFLIQMPLYEYLKVKTKQSKYLTNVTSKNDLNLNLNTKEIFVITAFSKTVATLCLYPLDTLRAHIRNNGNSIFSTIKYLNKNPISYYYGIFIYLFRSIPYHSATFCTYEYFKNKKLKK